jgi:hypothetical protein
MRSGKRRSLAIGGLRQRVRDVRAILFAGNTPQKLDEVLSVLIAAAERRRGSSIESLDQAIDRAIEAAGDPTRAYYLTQLLEKYSVK